MLQLGVTQFFSWAALFLMWTYLKPAITGVVTDPSGAVLSEGATQTWVGVLNAIYPVPACIISRTLRQQACICSMSGTGSRRIHRPHSYAQPIRSYDTYDRNRHRLGRHTCNAILNPLKSVGCTPDRSLYGNIQFHNHHRTCRRSYHKILFRLRPADDACSCRSVHCTCRNIGIFHKGEPGRITGRNRNSF